MAVINGKKVGMNPQNRDSSLVIIIFITREKEILIYEPLV